MRAWRPILRPGPLPPLRRLKTPTPDTNTARTRQERPGRHPSPLKGLGWRPGRRSGSIRGESERSFCGLFPAYCTVKVVPARKVAEVASQACDRLPLSALAKRTAKRGLPAVAAKPSGALSSTS